MADVLWYPGHELLLDDVVRSQGCHVYDAAGRSYLDLEAGVWCASIGHAHPALLRVLAEQPARIAHAGFSYSSRIVSEAARDVLALLGFDGGRAVFLCSGADAVEYGVRVARAVSARPRFLTLADSYFGAYGSAERRAADEWYTFDWLRCGEAGGCGERCPHWPEIPFDSLGGLLLEPGSSSGLVRFPPRPLVAALERELRRRDGLVVVNEVTTGVGRTGEWFGFQHYELQPDVVALGKGLGAGYPVSVTACAPRVVERLAGRTIRFAQSHQNDPLGAAVAREVLRVIREEGLVERSRGTAAILRDGLDSLASRTGIVRETRGRGLMIAVELVDDPSAGLTARVHRRLLQEGFIVGRRPGVAVLRLDPPLTLEPADARAFLRAFERVLLESRQAW